MEIKSLIRKNILNLKPYTSARDIYESGILLDANENSYGSTFNEIKGLQLNRYPDPHQKDLRKIVSKFYNIEEDKLFFGVGSDEIIDLMIRIFCEPKVDNAVIPEPTYGMYKVCCDINNVETKNVLLTNDFQIDLNAVLNACDENTKIVFLCSPNNPTGNLLIKEDVLKLCNELNCIVVIDEAYIDFVEDGSIINEVQHYENLIVMRTFSKAWGLAGIRLGYCVAHSKILSYLFKIKAPYNINSLTRYAVTKAIENFETKNQYVSAIIKEKQRLKNQLETLNGIEKVFHSDANFLLFKCEHPKDVQKKLADKGIIIRDRSSQPMLEGCLRISIGNEEENDFLWEEIRKIL